MEPSAVSDQQSARALFLMPFAEVRVMRLYLKMNGPAMLSLQGDITFLGSQ